MHNFEALQKRCKVYRMKKKLKYLLLLILFSLIAFYFYNNTNSIIHVSTEDKNTIVQNPIHVNTEDKNTTVPHPIKKPPIKKETKTLPTRKQQSAEQQELTAKTKKYSLQFLVISPRYINRAKNKKKYLESLGFKECKLIQSVVYIHVVCNESDSLQDLQSYINLAKRKKIDYLIRTQTDTSQQQAVVKEKEEQTKKITPPQQTTHSMIKIQNADIQEMQKSFSKNPNYAVALVIARDYYKKNNYKEAIIWAKKANQLNKSDAQSWIIYAKSLYALNEEEKAKQLLHIYLQYENSDEVENLLKRWEHR